MKALEPTFAMIALIDLPKGTRLLSEGFSKSNRVLFGRSKGDYNE